MIALLLVAGTLALPDIGASGIRKVLSAGSGDAAVELFVNPEGKVLRCKVLQAESRSLGIRLCKNAIGQDVGDGARDPNGRPVHGYDVIARVMRNDREPGHDPMLDLPPDLSIDVAQMPGPTDRRRVNVTVYVDQGGKVRQCLPPSQEDTDFSRIACEQAMAQSFPTAFGETREAVDYVTMLSVDFVRTKAAN